MNTDKILALAKKQASNAKPGHMTIDGKLYTFCFDQNEWVYKVYENGFFLMNVNTKTLSSVKNFIKNWLKN